MLNETKILLLGLMLMTSILLLGMSSTPQEKEIIKTRQELAGKELKLAIKQGQHWLHELQVIPWLPIIKVKNPPQIAVWIEDQAENYSGGEWGSGQPAVVYASEVDLTEGKSSYQLRLIGHSSPDGSNGKLTKDVTNLTTAKKIVESIKLIVE